MQDFLDKLAAVQRAHQLAADYEKTLCLLRALKAGDVQLDQVMMQSDGWQVVALPVVTCAGSGVRGQESGVSEQDSLDHPPSTLDPPGEFAEAVAEELLKSSLV